jgi:ribonuclease HI
LEWSLAAAQLESQDSSGSRKNHVAEYVALLEALQCALLLKATALRVFSDSEGMVKQMSGE